MTLPTYKVEIAFNAGALTPAASRTWTDVTAYTLLDSGVDITYGRGDWRSAADANRLRLTLNNSDGRFTPGLTTSPYYPNVKLGRPIRVTATVSGVTTTRLLGFVDEWPVEWPSTVGTFATVSVTASSRLAWIADDAELKSIVESEILLDDPVAYYTLGEAAGATTASDSSGNPQVPALKQTGSGTAVVFGNATGPGTDSLTAATFANGKYLRVAPGALYDHAMVSFNAAAPPASRATLVGEPDFLEYIQMETDGTLTCAQLGLASALSYADGETHVAAVMQDAGTAILYVDGVSVDTAAGISFEISGLSVGHQFSGTLAHVAVFDTPLSATRVAAISEAMLTGFAGETVASRLTRYASYAGIAATEVSFETGMVPDLAHIDTTGITALEMMRKIEATEEGVLFDAADGTLTFHARNHRYSATPAFTLDVAAKQVAPGVSPRLDRAGIRNDVTATLTDGTASAHAFNQTSIDAYGPARESLDLATTNAEEPFQHANWLVGQYAEPRPRVSQLGVINLVSLPAALTQAILTAGVGTRFRVTGMPSQAEKATQDYYIEGYSESIGPARHTITLNVSQAEPFDVWTVEDPVLGQYDAYPICL